MEALGAIQERLRNHDARLNANHDSIGTLRGEQASQQIELAVTRTELREVREDIAEMKKDLTGQLAWLRRGLWLAAGTFLMFFVAVATLVVQVAGG